MNTCEATPSAAQEIRIQSLGTPEIDSPLSRNLATGGERRVVFTVDEELVDEGAAPRPMSFELAAYGALAGVCYSRWHGGVKGVYLSLLAALVGGRLVWGLVSIPIYGLLTEQAFTLAAFWMGGFVNAWPGIVLQIVLIPAIVLALEKAKLFQQQ